MISTNRPRHNPIVRVHCLEDLNKFRGGGVCYSLNRCHDQFGILDYHQTEHDGLPAYKITKASPVSSWEEHKDFFVTEKILELYRMEIRESDPHEALQAGYVMG